MKKHLLTLLALLFSTVSFAVDWTEITSGEICSVTSGVDAFWKITAKADGIATITPTEETKYNSSNCYAVYADEGMAEMVETNWDFGTYSLSFAVVAGKTYYIAVYWPWASWDVVVSMPGEGGGNTNALRLVNSRPEEGGSLGYSDEYLAEITFSAPVVFSKGTLSCGECSTGIYLYTDYNKLVQEGIFTYTEEGSTGRTDYNGNLLTPVQGNTITIPTTSDTGLGYRNIVKEWVDAGKAHEGDVITVHLDSVTCTLNGEQYNGDGVLEMSFVLAGEPTTLVSANVPEVIKSWFNAGDPDAIATFTFSRGIRSALVMLEMGQGEGADDLYTENVAADHVSIEGNTVKVDLSGVMRTYKTMGLKNAWQTFNLILTNVVDADGQPTYSPDKGSASTYTYTCRYQDVSATVSYEITPANGSTLTADDKEVEIWFDKNSVIQYDGVTITYYTMETVTETVQQPVVDPETGEFLGYEDKEVEVEKNVAHETFVPNSDLAISIESDGSVTIVCPLPEGVWQHSNICVKLNVIGSVDGLDHVIAAYYNTSLMYGLQPELSADPVSESTVSRLSEIYLTLGYVYAINDQLADKVKVTSKTNPLYEGTAKVVADGMTNAKIVLDTPISEEGQYTVEVPEGVIGDYNYGESQYTSGTTHEAFNLYYYVDGKWAGKSVVCDPEEGEVNSLKKFTLTFFDYTVAPSWDTEKLAYVEKVVGEGEDPVQFAGDFVYDGSVGATNDIVFELMNTITTPGEYNLVIPAGAIAKGANGDPVEEEYVFHYTVVLNPVVAEKPVVDPAEGTYDEIGDILIDFGQPVTLVEPSEENNMWVPQPMIESMTDWSVYASGTLVLTDNPNVLKWVQDGTVVKGCDIVFSIPAGCVRYANGATNAEYTYNYTITGNNYTEPQAGGDPIITPEEGAVASLQHFTIIFDGWGGFNSGEGYPELKDADGVVVATAWNGLEYDWDDWTNVNKAFINFEEEITADGAYTLVVPVVLNDATWSLFEEKVYEFHYVIGKADTIGKILFADGAKADVYNVNGKLVLKGADAAAVNTLAPGVYVVNGKKVILK